MVKMAIILSMLSKISPLMEIILDNTENVLGIMEKRVVIMEKIFIMKQ